MDSSVSHGFARQTRHESAGTPRVDAHRGSPRRVSRRADAHHRVARPLRLSGRRSRGGLPKNRHRRQWPPLRDAAHASGRGTRVARCNAVATTFRVRICHGRNQPPPMMKSKKAPKPNRPEGGKKGLIIGRGAAAGARRRRICRVQDCSADKEDPKKKEAAEEGAAAAGALRHAGSALRRELRSGIHRAIPADHHRHHDARPRESKS